MKLKHILFFFNFLTAALNKINSKNAKKVGKHKQHISDMSAKIREKHRTIDEIEDENRRIARIQSNINKIVE